MSKKRKGVRARAPRRLESGSDDSEMIAYADRLDAEFARTGERAAAPRVVGYEVVPGARGEPDKLMVLGADFSGETTIYLDGRPLPTTLIDDARVLAEPGPVAGAGEAGRFHEISAANGSAPRVTALLGTSASRPAVTRISTSPAVPKARRRFYVNLELQTGRKVKPVFVHLTATFPDGETQEGEFRVSASEARAGRKRIGPFKAGTWGPVKVAATLYAADGSAGSARARIDVVPSNPFQVTVYPRYYGTSWKGAAQYESSTGRYYCRSRCVFSNGENHSVTINRSVTARVTDGGSHVTTFSFNLSSSYTVAANSSRTLYVYTYYRNSDTADIFENFGDVRIELTFSTSEGSRSDSAVWVMMGQVNVACNFVGSFSNAERQAVRNLTLGRASSIYEAVDISITSAPILEIPSSNGDWGRYRDIRIDSCKGGISSDEGDDMRSGWSSPGSYARHIDLWFVESFSGESCAASTGGFSPRPGPASKSGSKSGVIIDVKDLDILNSTWGSNVLGVVIAHELGHYLGLEHHGTSSNFMAASTGGNNMDITWDQHNIVDDHDWVQRLNP